MDELINELYNEDINKAFESDADPLGSYTGTGTGGNYNYPEQDADDL